MRELEYMTHCYASPGFDPKARGMLAIQAFVFAGEHGLEIPDWAMQEIGQRFSKYWRENDSGTDTTLDKCFDTAHQWGKMQTNTRDLERSKQLYKFEVLFDLTRPEAIAVMEKAGLDYVDTKIKAHGDKHEKRQGKAKATTNHGKAALAKPFKDQVSKRFTPEQLEEARQALFVSLPPEAQALLKDITRK